MDKKIIDMIKKAEFLYESKLISENSLGNSDNMIFEMNRDEAPIILRISQYSEENKAHTDFELKWLIDLSKEVDQVAKPINSIHGRLYEVIDSHNSSYIISAFEKAKGKLVNPRNSKEWHEGLFENLGQIMGRIHSRSTDYIDHHGGHHNFTWKNDLFFRPEYDFIEDDALDYIWNDLLRKLENLPKSKESYGIIHNDLHHLNFFVDGENIKIFDFDGCRYGWYFYDLVLTMYHMIFTPPHKEEKHLNAFAEKFMVAFLKGYSQHKSLGVFWLDTLDLFLKYRRLCSYRFVMHLSRKSESDKYRPYCKWLRDEIIKDQAFVSLELDHIKSILKSEVLR